ncbi:ribosomal protein S18-alanine N-acetyltransferase [Effusibacillus dendaii]|uniref:Ribosomal-protein-alanine acetyltransferase n=1 Tax=Effusibacillus dendaii TaxID=2743772 RepID=A0A7I8DF58_9BACL|nr:ribosomal protein S18-alanine N-acetyltransferase [Effusibacillus dendaii]BCJ87190.1 ribosomal-protein-alanine acetyltransferase [Effusibacillus dendaii]
MSGLTYRKMQLSDIDRVMEIEHKSFPAPWSRVAFEGELLRNHFAKYIVILLGGQIVGYSGMWIILDEAHITTIAVDPDFQGRKIGEHLLRQMMVLAVWNSAERMTLEVRVSNKVAQNLYQKMGFVNCGIRKKYYSDNQEDAIIMWADLDPNQQGLDRMEG